MHLLTLTTFVYPFGPINLWLHILILSFPALYFYQDQRLMGIRTRVKRDQFQRRSFPALVVSLLYWLCALVTLLISLVNGVLGLLY